MNNFASPCHIAGTVNTHLIFSSVKSGYDLIFSINFVFTAKITLENSVFALILVLPVKSDNISLLNGICQKNVTLFNYDFFIYFLFLVF